MPRITVLNTGEVVEASPVVSVLNNLLRAGIPIRHRCGGRAICGTCLVFIENGTEFLSPVKERERTRLNAVKADASARLACQTYTFGDISIRVKNLLVPR